MTTKTTNTSCMPDLHLHTPMPPEVDPDAPPPTSDPDPSPPPDDVPPNDPDRAPDGDPPGRPPPQSVACLSHALAHTEGPAGRL
ncbi:hypothetical protein B0G81_1978 [Paraburkholderia sp. BL6665CI2N2]|uniref:hypothetical protein n=1 Tax=Paraburkholderia sp. BL6665CI2N2 TaxID=1938806 RepID=UPI0010655416|nr:hypothetical protein [Paraburkholderia sp. BL6665CI2N2]TDY21748.1 hypothetical protein B0G81_1978 [Paraburkholderia sp. BL6665CI2N2]